MSKTKECFAYNTKIIETPTTKEVYIYENPIFIHSKEKADLTDTSNRKKFDEMSAHKQYDSLKRKQKHYEQARWDIARIVDCNFDNKTKFVTNAVLLRGRVKRTLKKKSSDFISKSRKLKTVRMSH